MKGYEMRDTSEFTKQRNKAEELVEALFLDGRHIDLGRAMAFLDAHDGNVEAAQKAAIELTPRANPEPRTEDGYLAGEE